MNKEIHCENEQKWGISELKKIHIEFEYVCSEFCHCNPNVFSTIGQTKWANNV